MSGQKQESLTRKVARNTIVQFTGKTIATFLAIFIASLMMRYLGPGGFGEYTIVITFLAIFSTLADLGLQATLTREISKKGAQVEKIVSNIFTMKLLFSLGILLLAPLTALFFPYSEIVKRGILIGVVSYLCLVLVQLLWGIFQKHFHMEKVAVGEVTAKIVWLLGVIFCIRFNLNLLYIIAFVALANFINFVIIFLSAQRFAKIKLAFDFLEWKNFIKIAYPLAIMAILTLIYFKVNIILLSVLKSEVEVGIYGAANKVIEFLITLPAIFAGLLFPVLSRTIFLEKDKFRKVFQKGFNALSVLALPLVLGTQFFARPVIKLLGGEKFLASADVLRILIFSCGFIFFAHLFSYTVIAANQQRKAVWFYGLAAVIAVLGNLIFIPYFSYYATAVVSIFSEATISFGCLWLIIRATKFRPHFKVFFKALVSSLIMIGFLYLLPKWNFLISLVLSIVVYFGILYALKGFSRETVKEIIRLK